MTCVRHCRRPSTPCRSCRLTPRRRLWKRRRSLTLPSSSPPTWVRFSSTCSHMHTPCVLQKHSPGSPMSTSALLTGMLRVVALKHIPPSDYPPPHPPPTPFSLALRTRTVSRTASRSWRHRLLRLPAHPSLMLPRPPRPQWSWWTPRFVGLGLGYSCTCIHTYVHARIPARASTLASTLMRNRVGTCT